MCRMAAICYVLATLSGAVAFIFMAAFGAMTLLHNPSAALAYQGWVNASLVCTMSFFGFCVSAWLSALRAARKPSWVD
jgi:hypothetical protein